MANPLPAPHEPAYHCCDYCDRFRTDMIGMVNAAGHTIGYACLYCLMVHRASIARRKAGYEPPTPWAY